MRRKHKRKQERFIKGCLDISRFKHIRHREVYDSVKGFIDAHRHEDYGLSVCDSITGDSLEIRCPIDQIPKIVERLCLVESCGRVDSIAVDALFKCYTVKIKFNEQRLDWGYYRFSNGHLRKIEYKELISYG